MGIQINKQSIEEYRTKHNLGKNISDEQIISIMNGKKYPTTEKTSTDNGTSIFQNKTNSPQSKELQSLGYINNKDAGKKIKSQNGKTYTIVGEATNGRKIVKDTSGQLQVMSHDNKILNKSYVVNSNKKAIANAQNKAVQKNTIMSLNKHLKTAEQAFEKQMAEDGWAGDLADGISVLWGSDNRASKVEKDLKNYKQNLSNLQKAAAKGDKEFNAQFKKMFGIDYNQNAVNTYLKDPTEENYQKAFGTKINIMQRVQKYNESQQTGAAIVKTGATVAAGVAIGVATGGTGLVALGAAAAATTASSVAINASDRLTSETGLKDGEMTQIMKDAAWDGASVLAGGAVGKIAGTAIKGATTGAKTARAVVNTAGDTAMGAAQEYAETGHVSATGTALNAALGSVGIAAETGTLNKVGQKLKGSISPEHGNTSTSTSASTPKTDNTVVQTIDTPPVSTQTTSDTPQIKNTQPNDKTIDTSKEFQSNIQFSDSEKKAFTRVKNGDAIQEILNNIAQKINDGETPTINLKKAAIKEVAEKHGLRQMELNIETGIVLGDLSKVDASWKNLNDAIQTDNPGPEVLKGIEIFKQNKNLTSSNVTPSKTPTLQAESDKITQFRGTSLEVLPEGTTFLNGIMSNIENTEKYLKNADLTNESVRESFTNILENDFPGFKFNPKSKTTLNQLQQLLNHPEYNNLSDANKTIAKLSILKDSGIDPTALQSKYKASIALKRRIEDIEYCLQGNQKGAAALYHKGDYETFKILNDIKTSSKTDIAAADAIKQKADSNGHIMVQQSHIINKNKIPVHQISKNGNIYNVRVIDLTDKKVLANLEQYGFGSGATADNLRLTVHMNDGFNQAPQQTIGRMRNSSELNLSATLTDGKNHLYGDMQYGVVLDYDQGALSYASNYAAGTGFTKNRSSFSSDKLGESVSSADHFIRDRFIENMKKNGSEITTDDYNAISALFKDHKMTVEQMNNLFPDGTLTANGKKFKTSDIQTALEQSSNDLLTMRTEIMGGHFKEGFNELNVYNPEIKAIYIRDNSTNGTIQDIMSEKLLKYAQDNNIPIVFQRNSINT